MLRAAQERLLAKVSRPARYLGHELNSVHKDHQQVEVTFGLCFPDVYEVGMSHLGLKVLYDILNRREDVACERAFAPWPDMIRQLLDTQTPLWALESGKPLGEFDILGFSLQHELNFTNVLLILDLAGIPLRSADRGPQHPLVVGGGPAAFNPEPLAEFFDLFVIGDGEQAVHQLVEAYCGWRRDRPGLLSELAAPEAADGFYVPGRYTPHYAPDGRLTGLTPLPGTRPAVRKALVADLAQAPFPEEPVVPFLDVVHDRVTLEICRGCTRGCRFCQAGMIYRPVRERPLLQLLEQARRQIQSTGHDEISLASLSSSDYSGIRDLARRLVAEFGGRGVGVSLPSLRIDSFSVGLADEVQKVRKSGLTFAPEAGTERLRRVINKNVTEDDLLESVDAAFRLGWDGVKLYFMLGLPTETDEDLQAIAELARKVGRRHRELRPGRGFRLALSCASFVPKPHTPFQWEPQVEREELLRRQEVLRQALPRRIKFSWHDARQSFIEAALARGDRRQAAAVERAYRLGCRFDAWDEHFRFDLWQQAFAETGLDPAWYANRLRGRDELLPWDHIDSGVTKQFLWAEREAALRGESTPDCREGSCTACGVCAAFGVAPVVHREQGR